MHYSEKTPGSGTSPGSPSCGQTRAQSRSSFTRRPRFSYRVPPDEELAELAIRSITTGEPLAPLLDRAIWTGRVPVMARDVPREAHEAFWRGVAIWKMLRPPPVQPARHGATKARARRCPLHEIWEAIDTVGWNRFRVGEHLGISGRAAEHQMHKYGFRFLGRGDRRIITKAPCVDCGKQHRVDALDGAHRCGGCNAKNEERAA
jgi:hypothetical protein